MKRRYIFVFGSNLEGRHKRGAAKDALTRWGAIMWQGEGLQGDCYALPTKATWQYSLPLIKVIEHIIKFVDFAKQHPELTFLVTKVGTNLAGFTEDEIGPAFAACNPPENCLFDPDWVKYGLQKWEKSPNELRPENPVKEKIIFDSIYPNEA